MFNLYSKYLRRVINISLIFSLTAFYLLLSVVPVAHAAALTALSDTMSSSKITTASSHVLKFTTPTGAAESTDTIIITFPADFDFTSKTISTLSFTHGASTGLETTETFAANPTGSVWGAVFSGTANRILTLTAPTDGIGIATVAASDKIIITYNSTNSINATTPATSYAIAITGAFGDTGTITVYLITNDQVAVTATVNQTLTFAISDVTIGFGTLTTANRRDATGDTNGQTTEVEAHNMTVSTNAASGYILTVLGATLNAGSPTITALGSNTASSAGTEQFGLRMDNSGGNGTVTAPYAASGYAYTGTASTAAQVAASSTSSFTTTYSVRYLANIAGDTEAGSYSTTLTYTTTATF